MEQQNQTSNLVEKPFFEKTASYKFDEIDFSFALATVVLAYLYSKLIFANLTQAGYLVFAIFFFATVFGYIYKKTKVFPSKALPYAILSIASAIPLFLYSITPYASINMLITTVSAVYTVAVATNTRLENTLGEFVVYDAFNLFVFRPFKNFSAVFCAMFAGRKYSGVFKKIVVGLVAVAATFVVGMFAFSNLSNVDENFSQAMDFVNHIDFGVNFTFEIYFLIITIPIACYLFGLFYASVNKRHLFGSNHSTICEKRQTRKPISTFLPALPMLTLCIIYIVFFVAHIITLVDVFTHGGVNYAQYARDGFFELCKIAVLNFGLCVFNMAFCKKDGKLPRILTVLNGAILASTLLFMGTAATKLAMYINFYSITLKRIYAGWVLSVIFVAVLLLIINQFKKINFVKCITLFAAISFISISICGPGNIVNAISYQRYQNEKITLQEFKAATAGSGYSHYSYSLEIFLNPKTEQDKKQISDSLYYFPDIYSQDLLLNVGTFSLDYLIAKNTLALYEKEIEEYYNKENFSTER